MSERTQKLFPLRLPEQQRSKGRRIAESMGVSENRLYADLISEGLLMREQMAYLEKLRRMDVSATEGLRILDDGPDRAPAPDDRIPARLKKRIASRRPTRAA